MHLNTHPGFQGAASALALITAALLWIIWGHQYPRIVVFLIIGGIGGLADTGIGRFIHSIIAPVFGWIDHLTRIWVGSGIAFGIAIWVAAVTFIHVKEQKIEDTTLYLAAAFTVTVTFIPGLLGEILVGVLAFCANIIGLVFYWPFHGHF